MNSDRKSSQLIMAAILMEGLLLIIWLIWKALTDYAFKINISTESILIGILAVIPLLLLNYLLFLKNPTGIFFEFLKEIIEPLCSHITPKGAIFISLAAGICEELFFRDFLMSSLNHVSNIYIAILVNSIAFGVVHFTGYLKKYWKLVVLYSGIGVFFSLLLLYSQSLFSVIIAHALYDYLAINLVKRRL